MSYLHYVVGTIVVVTKPQGMISIKGVSLHYLIKDIQQYYSTSRVGRYLFKQVGNYELHLQPFFAVEFAYVLTELLKQKQTISKKATIDRVLSLLYQNTWLKQTQAPQTPWLDYKQAEGFTYKLLPHQTDFLKKYEADKKRLGLKGMLLSAAAGSGKTAMDIAIARAVHSDVCIIVCPLNSIYRVWEKTLTQELAQPEQPYIADRDGLPQPGKRYYIFHYERLDYAQELVKQLDTSNTKITIILDECHNLNAIKSLRTQRFIELCEQSKSDDIIWASGTPVKAMGAEVIPLLRTIDPYFNETVEQSFKKLFVGESSKALAILSHRLGLISFTVPRRDVMTDKPIEETVYVKIPNSDQYLLSNLKIKMQDFVKTRYTEVMAIRPEAIKWYMELLKNYRQSLNTPSQLKAFDRYQSDLNVLIKTTKFSTLTHGPLAESTNLYEKNVILPWITDSPTRHQFLANKSIVKYPMLKVQGECLGLILTKARIDCHIDMLEHIDFKTLIESVEKKTLIFTSYVRVLEALNDRLESIGYNPLLVYGDTNSQLSGIVSTFSNDKKANPLCATFQSLSTAVPLTMANGIIMLNSPWRSFEREQTIARAHRLGQDRPVYVFDIILDTGTELNISSRSLDIMKWSKEQVELITGVKSDLEISGESMNTQTSLEDDIVQEIAEQSINIDELVNPVIEPIEPTLPISVPEHQTEIEELLEESESASVEFMNAFMSAGLMAKQQLNKVFNATKQVLNVNNDLLSNVDRQDMLRYINDPEIQIAIQAKTIRYSSLSPVTVFTPSNLKMGCKMTPYTTHLSKCMRLAHSFMQDGLSDYIQLLETCIGNPNRLSEITDKTPYRESYQQELNVMVEMQEQTQSWINNAESKATRPFKQCYNNMNDYLECRQRVSEIHTHRQEMIKSLATFQKQIAHANKTADRLIALIQSKPEQYSVSSTVANQLAKSATQSALVVEYVGAMFQMSLQAIVAFVDTTMKIKNDPRIHSM